MARNSLTIFFMKYDQKLLSGNTFQHARLQTCGFLTGCCEVFLFYYAEGLVSSMDDIKYMSRLVGR
uniref:Uncharacterized protein n=1 Tax=Rhizophora mucronata TaxID=61149 RepID=A0A2P2MXL9_RHIMU